jgi:hypothetical protein
MRESFPIRPISRRFLISAVAGGAVTFGFPFDLPLASEAAAASENVEPYNWVVIAPHNTVTIRILVTRGLAFGASRH